MRLPSREVSTICGPPLSGPDAGCAARETIPPSRTEPVSRGARGSETSKRLSSPVPQQET